MEARKARGTETSVISGPCDIQKFRALACSFATNYLETALQILRSHNVDRSHTYSIQTISKGTRSPQPDKMSGNTPKSMSNRLMTMKASLLDAHVAIRLLTRAQFMQRSAAKNVASSPTTSNGPASKKVRLSNGGSVAADHQILQSALAEEAKKQQEALDKAAQHTGETKWVLSYTDPLEGKRGNALNVRQAGFAELDADDSGDEDEEEQAQPIRRQYGGGVKKATVRYMQEL